MPTTLYSINNMYINRHLRVEPIHTIIDSPQAKELRRLCVHAIIRSKIHWSLSQHIIFFNVLIFYHQVNIPSKTTIAAAHILKIIPDAIIGILLGLCTCDLIILKLQ